MDMSLATPALLFPAVSLLLLVYANRFLAIAKVIRGLGDEYKENPNQKIFKQIESLRNRVILIRNMHALGIACMFVCVLCMFVLFYGNMLLGKYLFGFSLLLLLGSLGLSFREIQISVKALHLHLSDLKQQ